MKKIKAILSAIALSLALPIANVSATNEPIDTLSATVSASSVHVEGTTAALAAAIEILDEAGTTSIAGPETISVVSGAFSYDFSGTFDITKVYTVRAADYDAGTWKVIQTTAATAPTNPSDNSSTAAGNPNTGVAPKRSESADRATANISLGVSIVIASAITYAFYLVNKRKA